MWLVPTLILAQAQQPLGAADPALVSALVEAAAKIVGMGSGGSILLLGIAYFAKEWFKERRRGGSEEMESALKRETRTRIGEQGEALAQVAAAVADVAREMGAMRRESYQAHADIKAAIAAKG